MTENKNIHSLEIPHTLRKMFVKYCILLLILLNAIQCGNVSLEAICIALFNFNYYKIFLENNRLTDM